MKYAELLRTIDEFDLEAYLLDKGFEPSRSKSEEWIGRCPTCGKDKLCVDVQKRGWHCWVCQRYEDYWDARSQCFKRRPAEGAGGAIALVKHLDQLDTREAIAFLAQHSASADLSALPDLRVVEQVLDAAEAPEIPPPPYWAPIHQPLPYMVQRGLTMEDVRSFGLFHCVAGRYRDRLVFPVYEGGRLIYWQARAMYEADAVSGRFVKALNPERTPGAVVSSECLMNIDVAVHFPRVAIVEGPMDCVRTGSDAVCTFGKQLSPMQVRRLLSRGVRAVDLMWDGPKGKEPQGAWPEMLRVAPWLSVFFDVRLVFLPQGDPGDWSREQLLEQRWRGVPAEALSQLSTL